MNNYTDIYKVENNLTYQRQLFKDKFSNYNTNSIIEINSSGGYESNITKLYTFNDVHINLTQPTQTNKEEFLN